MRTLQIFLGVRLKFQALFRDEALREAVIIYEQTCANQVNAMTVAELPIKIDQEKIAEFCRAKGIRKLSLFGSVLHDDFDPDRSDVDVLVEFFPNRIPGWEFFRFAEELAPIIGRSVDLNTPSMLSQYFRDEVLSEAVPVYEQT